MPDIPATGWGFLGVAFTLLVTKGFEAFSQKEKQESDLVTKLVESQQTGNEKLLDQLVSVQKDQYQAQKDQYQALIRLEAAIASLSDAVKVSFEMHDRKIAYLEQKVQQLEGMSCPLPTLKK